MNILIKPKHTDGITFDNRKSGALVRAANEQLSDIKITEEFDGYCIDSKGNHYDVIGYSRQAFQQLRDRQIKQIAVILELNNIY